jgi:hypothetical protein
VFIEYSSIRVFYCKFKFNDEFRSQQHISFFIFQLCFFQIMTKHININVDLKRNKIIHQQKSWHDVTKTEIEALYIFCFIQVTLCYSVSKIIEILILIMLFMFSFSIRWISNDENILWIHLNSWHATSSLWTTLMLELDDEWFLIKSYLKILYKCFSSHFTCWISRSHATWSIHHIIIKCHQMKT